MYSLYIFERAIPVRVVGKTKYWRASNLVAKWQAKRRKVTWRRFTRVCAPGRLEERGKLCKDPITEEALNSALYLGLEEVGHKRSCRSWGKFRYLVELCVCFPRLLRSEWIIAITLLNRALRLCWLCSSSEQAGGLRNRSIIYAKLLFLSLLKPKLMLDKHKNLVFLLGSLLLHLGKINLFSYTLWPKRFRKSLLSADCVIKMIGVFSVMFCYFFPQMHTYNTRWASLFYTWFSKSSALNDLSLILRRVESFY